MKGRKETSHSADKWVSEWVSKRANGRAEGRKDGNKLGNHIIFVSLSVFCWSMRRQFRMPFCLSVCVPFWHPSSPSSMYVTAIIFIIVIIIIIIILIRCQLKIVGTNLSTQTNELPCIRTTSKSIQRSIAVRLCAYYCRLSSFFVPSFIMWVDTTTTVEREETKNGRWYYVMTLDWVVIWSWCWKYKDIERCAYARLLSARIKWLHHCMYGVYGNTPTVRVEWRWYSAHCLSHRAHRWIWCILTSVTITSC